MKENKHLTLKLFQKKKKRKIKNSCHGFGKNERVCKN